MKVVHAAKFYPPVRGGMETVVGDLCRGTAHDWNVRVVAASVDGTTRRERVDDVDVVRVGALGTAHSVPLCPAYPWHLWREPADCLILHEPNPLAGSSVFLRTPARHLVIWHHSDLVRPWWARHTYGRVQRVLYRRADCVIVSSPNLAAESALVRSARRVAVIPFGVPIDRYRALDAARQERAKAIAASIPGPRVLFVGRLVYYKGVDVLLRAMVDAPGTLVLVGEGPLDGELRTLAESLGLRGRVVFAGRVADEDLPAYYRTSDVFVLPSVARTEAFGVVQVEAMAAGLPVVSTNLPTGVPWVNQDGVSGLVVPPADPRALGAAIASLLRDDVLRRRLGQNAAARAEAKFTRDRMVASFRTVVEAAVGSPDQLDAQLARAEGL